MPDTAALRELLNGLRQDRKRMGARSREAGLCADRLLVRVGRLTTVVPIDQLLYVEQKGERIHFHLADGQVVTGNSSYTMDGLAHELAGYTLVRRVHEYYLANLAHLAAIGPAPAGQEGRLLRFGPGRAVLPLADSHATGVQKALGLESLDHVVPWNERYAAILREGIRDFDDPITTFSVERLRAEFRYKTTPDINLRELMANMLWQYHSWLKLPESDPRKTWPIDGNIRTFWYYIKPVVSRLGFENVYDPMIELLSALVRAKVFRYRDFGFVDEGESNRQLPKEGGAPHIVFVAEKAGHFAKLERLQTEFGFTIVALGGTPSLLSVEYLLDELRDVVDLKVTPLRLISMVDYDPAGAIVIASFCDHLGSYGVQREDYTLSHVMHPDRFTREELPNVVFNLPSKTQSDRTKAERWIARGGGIDGKPLGIECEALLFDYGRARRIVAELVAEAQKPMPPKALAAEPPSLSTWELPPHFSAELLEEDEAGFWARWAEAVAGVRNGAAGAPESG